MRTSLVLIIGHWATSAHAQKAALCPWDEHLALTSEKLPDGDTIASLALH